MDTNLQYEGMPIVNNSKEVGETVLGTVRVRIGRATVSFGWDTTANRPVVVSKHNDPELIRTTSLAAEHGFSLMHEALEDKYHLGYDRVRDNGDNWYYVCNAVSLTEELIGAGITAVSVSFPGDARRFQIQDSMNGETYRQMF